MDMQKNARQFFEALAESGVKVSPEYRDAIEARMAEIIGYKPLIGVFGKTGAGKSSLCNALFGREICPVSDIDACTRAPQEVALGVGQRGMTLLDVPGVGENGERDREYASLYRQLMPRLDLLIWVLKGDDRAYTSDESFYKSIVRPYVDAGTPFFLVLNQVDKVEPFREWNESARRPGPLQSEAIERKRHSVAAFFGVALDRVHAVSADERYGLIELVDAVIHVLPREKRVAMLREVRSEYRSESAEEAAGLGFLDAILDFVKKNVPEVAKTLIGTVCTKLASKAVSFFRSLF